MNIPFTAEHFYGVFTAYNKAVWPMQLPLLALGVLAVVLLTRQRSYSSVGISATLTVLWLLQALAAGSQAAFAFDLRADLGLIAAGVFSLAVLVRSKDDIAGVIKSV